MASKWFPPRSLHGFQEKSDLKREQAMTAHRRVPGVAFLRSNTKLAVLCKLKKVVKGVEQLFLGTTSNNASSVRPKFLSTDITKSVLVAVDKEAVPSFVEIGKDIDKSHSALGGFFCDNAGQPHDNEAKVLARISVGLPLIKGAQIQAGNIDQGTCDTLEDLDTAFMAW